MDLSQTDVEEIALIARYEKARGEKSTYVKITISRANCSGHENHALLLASTR